MNRLPARHGLLLALSLPLFSAACVDVDVDVDVDDTATSSLDSGEDPTSSSCPGGQPGGQTPDEAFFLGEFDGLKSPIPVVLDHYVGLNPSDENWFFESSIEPCPPDENGECNFEFSVNHSPDTGELVCVYFTCGEPGISLQPNIDCITGTPATVEGLDGCCRGAAESIDGTVFCGAPDEEAGSIWIYHWLFPPPDVCETEFLTSLVRLGV